MKVGKYTISFPVFNITTRVTHLTIRSPTVFERMILRLCSQQLSNSGLGKLTFREIFEQKLGVSSAEELVGPSIDNLQVLGVLNAQIRTSQIDQPLNTYQLTSQGNDFYRRNRMPGLPKYDDVRHLYFSLDDSVSRSGTPLVNHADLYINPDLIPPSQASLQTQIRDVLNNEKYDWKTVETEISSLSSKVGKVEWENVEAVLNCDSSGVLTFSAPASPRLNQWLSLADSNMVWDQLLSVILIRESDQNEGNLDLLDESIFKSAVAFHPLMGRGGEVKRVNEPVVQIVRDLSKVSVNSKEPILLISAEISTPRSSLRADGGLLFEFPQPDFLPNGFTRLEVARDSENSLLMLTGEAPLFWAGQAHRCALNVVFGSVESNRLWQQLVSDYSEWISSSTDQRIELLPAAWERPEYVIERWLTRRSLSTVHDLLLSAGFFELTFAQISRVPEKQWKPVWHQNLKNSLALAISHINQSLQLPDLLSVLVDLNKILGSQAAALLQSQLLTHAVALQNHISLEKVRACIQPGLVLPRNLLSNELLEDWVNQAIGVNPMNLQGPHDFVHPLNSLRHAKEGLLRHIGDEALQAACIGKIDARKITKNALLSISEWKKAVSDLDHVLSFSMSDKGPKSLCFLLQQVEKWSAACSQFLAPTQARRVVVFDTSAVMNLPTVFTRLTERDFGVAPLRMLEELDGLKSSTDEQQAYKARSAINAVNIAINEKQLHLEPEHLDLLPAEWGDSPDNRILTTAMYYKLNDVLLVSDDKNLRNKTTAIGISANPSLEYFGLIPQSKKQQKRGIL